MKAFKNIITLALIFSASLFASAQSADTIHVISQNKVHMGGYGSYNAWAVFPPDTNSYRKVLLNFTLGCPSGGCSAWDYTVDIYLMHNTHIKDSSLQKAPTFTVNGKNQDSVFVVKDTTYITYYDTTTHKTDSTANTAYTIIQYKDSLTPTTPTDTLKWWIGDYYKYYYDTTGKKIDSIYVLADSSMYLRYYSYYKVYDSIEQYEIARMITPYAGYYAKTWTYPYVFDVTDFDCMMNDSVQIQVFYSGYTDGFTATCDFAMITGTPPHKAYKTLPMWTGSFPYGNASDPISNYLVPKPIKIDSAASATRLRILQTGHGEDNNNCTEFCANYQHVKINSKEHFTPLVWKDDCGLNPLYHQAGTWLYDRANWCPGEQITPYLDDLTPYVVPKQVDTILMSMDPYISPNGGSIYTIGASLIYYGPINYSVDASLDDIITPANTPLYSRINPVCGNPKVAIRNTGSTPLTSVDIVYGAVGGASNTYHWTGNLLFDDTVQVDLPNIALVPCSKPYTFRARVTNPNGVADQYSANDSLSVPFAIVPNYPNKFVIQLTTNNAAWEDSYFIVDAAGKIWDSKTGFNNASIYKDTVDLPTGCYHFEIDDAGKDGLSFFANTDGNGTLYFKHVSPATIFLNIQPDFGTNYIQNFTVGAVTGEEEVAQQGAPDYDVYPNPAKSTINIAPLVSSKEDMDVKMYSSLGELVYSSRMPANSDKFTINVVDLAQGLYCIVISGSDTRVVKKVTVVR
jgi:hypothetical protein